MRVTRYVLILAALTAMGLVTVNLRAQATRTAYHIARERVRQREILEERARLRMELAALKSPERMMRQAKTLNLELLPPDKAGPGGPARLANGPRRR